MGLGSPRRLRRGRIDMSETHSGSGRSPNHGANAPRPSRVDSHEKHLEGAGVPNHREFEPAGRLDSRNGTALRHVIGRAA
jgi:hypothetical protein